jgi:diguanylate cyclase (GGDEF)-like protein
MAVPVRQNEELIGCLVVASRTRGRTFTAAEQEMLEAFAVHASLALTDARLLEQVHDALHDPLTGLPNRALFTERLQESLTGSPAGDPDPAVLLLALDRLGVINETLGHSAGDMLLSAVAERLEECAAPSDTVARFAGGDFAILVADAAGRAEPEAVANRVLAAFTSPVQMGGREIAVSASIGIACGGTDADEALRHAGVAMHRARREGKGRYVRFSSEMKAALLRGLELEADLLRAVERKQFAVHYQPIVALNAHELIGFEALVRWRHPERGMVPPLAFIPLAEEMGLIDQIGSFVLREACGQAARWHAEHTTDPPLAIAVNLSARQLQRADLVDEVGDLLSEFGLEPRGLILEITESILMRDADMAVSRLWDLKRLGVRIAIDDFGTGYSSLQYIQSFPLDILKIAKPFIDGVARSAEGAALVRTIADLAKSFRLEVVAEGIETAPQYAALKRLGCQLGQGHHFHRPVDRETAARLLRRAAAGYGLKGDPGSPDLRLPGRGEPQARPAPALRSTRRVPI